MVTQRMARTTGTWSLCVALPVVMLLFGLPGFSAAQAGLDQVEGQEALNHEAETVLRVRIVTFGPSGPLLSRFGHSSLWVEDLEEGTSRAYNYGLSNTGAPRFLRQLVRGEVVARPSRADPEAMIERYAAGDRTVWIQELNLTSTQATALVERLEYDVGSNGEAYPHDFYTANCTTGIRDVLNDALSGRVRDQSEGVSVDGTYRSQSLQYASASLWLYFGLMLGMGRSVDHPIDAWESMFLPSGLRERLREITVVDVSGAEVPLVAREEVWYTPEESREVTMPSWHWPLGLVGGIGIGGLLVGLGRAAPTRRWFRVGFAGIAGLWLAVVGSVGVALAGLWAFTGQHLAYGNENLLVVHPLSLIAGWLILTGALSADGERRLVRWVAYVMALLSVVAVLVQPLPWFHQANGLILLLTVPPYLALAWALRCWDGGGSPATAVSAIDRSVTMPVVAEGTTSHA